MALTALFLVTIVGALISGLTGLAGGAVVLGGLMLFFPALEALAMHGVVQTASNGARVVFWSKSVHWLWSFGMHCCFSLVPGLPGCASIS